MIRLAAFDIDRTLVSQATGTIAPETAAALRQLRQQGILTAIATGRQWQQLPKMLKTLEFDYYILLNGTHITDSSGKLLHREQIPLQTVTALMQELTNSDLSLHLRFLDGIYSVLERDRVKPFGLNPEAVPEELKEGFLFSSPLENGELPMAALAHIPPETEDDYRRNYPNLDFLRVLGGKMCDVNPTGVTKATGLAQICRLLNIPMEQTIAFGDDINDVELIRDAGIGVAMADAIDEVRAEADYITDTCENLGVVKGLQHFGLIKL